MKDAKAVQGCIFDIKRFAIHDGNGIRTTVFLKGCPLSCIWCHNPEGIEKEITLRYVQSKCMHCGLCGVPGDDKLQSIPREHWERAVEICPTGALSFNGKMMTVDELQGEIEKDLPFYRETGGVTFSGGEPFVQYPFLLEMVKRLKRENIRVALETSGFCGQSQWDTLVPLIDMVHADMKFCDSGLHKKYTGVENGIIKRNITALLQNHKDVVIRTPLIPGVTATAENLEQIAQFLVEINPEVVYEILNYNPLGQGKYALIGREFKYKKAVKPFAQEKLDEFCQVIRAKGIKNLRCSG